MKRVGEDTEKREFSCTGGKNWYNHYGKQYGSSFKKLKIELPYNLAIPSKYKIKYYLKEIYLFLCSLQHYLVAKERV